MHTALGELAYDERYCLYCGYLLLNQLVKYDFIDISPEDLKYLFSIDLEEGEYVEYDGDMFILTLNYVNDEIVEYVKMILKYALVLYDDFNVNSNVISFRKCFEDENGNIR